MHLHGCEAFQFPHCHSHRRPMRFHDSVILSNEGGDRY